MGFEGSVESRSAKRMASSAVCVSPSRISLASFRNRKLEAAMMKMVATTSNSNCCQRLRHFGCPSMLMPDCSPAKSISRPSFSYER